MGNQGKEQELNKRHQAFAELIASGATATDAYLAAGYSAERRGTLHRNASRLRRDPRIRAAIRNLRYEADMIAREDTVLDIARKLTYLARLVTTGAGGLSADDELIQYSRTFKDGSTATRLPCKLKALKLHSQLAGHFDPKPEDLAPPKEREKSFDEELQELFDDIRSGRRKNAPPAPAPDPEGRAGFSEPADFTSGSREAASRVPESESPTSEGCAPASNHSAIRNTGAPEALGIACSEGTARQGETSGSERGNPQSALADVAPTSATPSHEGNPTNQNSNPHQNTSIDGTTAFNGGTASVPSADGRVENRVFELQAHARVNPFPTQMTSGLQGRVPSSIPHSEIRTPQLNFAPQPFPYSGHDYPELYGPKIRKIR